MQQPSGRPRIILHIGRNKAGSTTIQDFCQRERAALSHRGIDYVLFGHLAHSREDTPGFPTFESLREHALAHPERAHLVSNEFMFGWPDEYTEAAARVLHDCDTSILAYVRPYDDWIVSAYAEETRKGMNMRDIDAYVAWMQPRISAWPYLAKWGEMFGWGALRVRELSAAGLHGGDLIGDFLHGLGLDPWPAPAPTSNASPHWLELELARRLTERNGEVEWAGVAHAELEPLLDLLRPLLTGAPRATYLAQAEHRRLRALYEADLERIAAASGGPIPHAPLGDTPDRGAPPAFADAPAPLLAGFFARAADPAFVAAHPLAATRARRLAAETEVQAVGEARWSE